MTFVLGVVGPHDVVDTVAPYCDERDDVRALYLDYTDEAEAPAIVDAHAYSVDGWLFTGIGPYTMAERAGALDRPAVYVPYTREALQQALIRLLRADQPIDRLSVDTMSLNAVNRCLELADVDSAHVRVLPYRAGLSSADYASFHRRAQRGSNPATCALTCHPAVHELIRLDLASLLLRPTRHAVRSTLRHLTLSLHEQARGSAQIALGLIEITGDTSQLMREVRELDGYLCQQQDGTSMVVTTRGKLAEATAELTTLPMLGKLAAQGAGVRIGFGLGHTAAEAEHLARRGLLRARRLGQAAAVLSRRNDSDIVLDEIPHDGDPPRLTLDDLARRSGIASSTLSTIRSLDLGDADLTPGDLAVRLGLQARSARRVLRKLESAGLAERIGEELSGARGRPSNLYRIHVP